MRSLPFHTSPWSRLSFIVHANTVVVQLNYITCSQNTDLTHNTTTLHPSKTQHTTQETMECQNHGVPTEQRKRTCLNKIQQ